MSSTKGTSVSLKAHDPLMNLIDTQYSITMDGIAVIEMAKVSGLVLVPLEVCCC
jgi:glycerate kinase